MQSLCYLAKAFTFSFTFVAAFYKFKLICYNNKYTT